MHKIVRPENDWKFTIPVELRYSKIMEVLNNSTESLSAKEIAKRYVDYPTYSDTATTQVICNILCLAGLLKRGIQFKGKSTRSTYRKSK